MQNNRKKGKLAQKKHLGENRKKDILLHIFCPFHELIANS
jgi:hypothetical protein